ncbi:MAG: lytic murein transglycosylase [Spongiibacteraceae bacterium]
MLTLFSQLGFNAKRWSLWFITCLVITPAFVSAEEFAECVVNLQQKALTEGIPTSVIEGSLAKVEYVPRVIELDRRQPEFSQSFANYLNRRVTDWRVAQGRKILKDNRDLLDSLVKEYGVPAQYLVAFWGLETNYGSYLGKMPVLDSLATLACDERRSSYFTQELMQALHLLSQPGIKEPMLGSWAGAMGHTQFMPSAYRRYALDGDGDGSVNLWTSIPDALTSAANFLQQLGWQRELRWGREIKLPEQFQYVAAGLKNKQAMSYWQQQGVTTISDDSLPDGDMLGAVLVPAGYSGPAFLVYGNFEVIMRWNRSEFYALAVGHLADRINGAGSLLRPPPENMPDLPITKIKELQAKLNDLGFEAGTPDGIFGPGTRQALRLFQQSKKMVADGYPHREVFSSLGVEF